MKERPVRSCEVIEEDDGSTSLDVEYYDGTRETFTNVKMTGIEETGTEGPRAVTLKVIEIATTEKPR